MRCRSIAPITLLQPRGVSKGRIHTLPAKTVACRVSSLPLPHISNKDQVTLHSPLRPKGDPPIHHTPNSDGSDACVAIFYSFFCSKPSNRVRRLVSPYRASATTPQLEINTNSIIQIKPSDLTTIGKLTVKHSAPATPISGPAIGVCFQRVQHACIRLQHRSDTGSCCQSCNRKSTKSE